MMRCLSTVGVLIFIFGLSSKSYAQRYFALPLNSFHVNQVFGWRMHPITGELNFHDGLDLKADFEPVFSIADGEVVRVNADAVSGKYVLIRHAKLMSHYAHLSRTIVSDGERVFPGQLIGVSGDSGRTTGPHLHFALSYCGIKLDALKFLQALNALNPGGLIYPKSNNHYNYTFK